jgi:hypothetical protein
MKDRSTAISTIGAVMLTLVFHSSASAQTKAQSPAQALVNLYQAAQQIIKDPDGDFEDGKNPDFPYPSQMQAQWDASMVAYGNNLSTQERALFPACAAHLNAAITDMEIGCRIKLKQPTEAAQQDGQKRMDEAPGEVAQCSAAIELAQSEIGSATSQPQQGGVDSSGANESTPAGSATEAALPGSIDWTPALDPLQTYLANEWQRTVNDPRNSSWAADNGGNTLTLKLQPGQLPEVLSATGSRSSVFNAIMQDGRLPATTFPNGSTLTSVTIAPTFFVKSAPGIVRTRLKYYERDGIFKSYRLAQ